MSSDESDMEINCTPPELRAEAEVALSNLLPPKSKVRYMTAYENFLKWKENKKANSFSETVFLAYFTELGKTKKASTLWSLYSMIKATVQLKQNINIKNYTNLVSWLKRQSDGYSAKKSKNFTCENVQNFLNNAPDETYLDVKAPPLYVRYQNASVPEPANLIPIRLSAKRDTNCRWTTVPLLPRDRLEGIGQPIQTGTKLIIKNCVADKSLGVMYQNWLQTFFGMECGVTCRDFIDVHKRFTAENIFSLVSDVATKKKE